MNVLLWRSWEPIYEFPATFSALSKYSMGGTCAQLLSHAIALRNLGHSVTVLGVSIETIEEAGVLFLGAQNQIQQLSILSSWRYPVPDVVLLEGAYHGAEAFRQIFPRAQIVHIGQNIDRLGARGAFRMEHAIDYYGFVSPGHLANYSMCTPELSHRFILVRNAVNPLVVREYVDQLQIEEKVVWVGSWGKRGLREWAEAMAIELRNRPTLKWVLCGPSYGIKGSNKMPPAILGGLVLPIDRVFVKTMPLPDVAREMRSAIAVLVSLGEETACISALDAHSLGRPVISGNDIVFKFINPEGTGLRVSTVGQCSKALRRLLDTPDLGRSLGLAGRSLVLQEFSVEKQTVDLQRMMDFLALVAKTRKSISFPARNAIEEYLAYISGKAKRKFREWKYRNT